MAQWKQKNQIAVKGLFYQEIILFSYFHDYQSTHIIFGVNHLHELQINLAEFDYIQDQSADWYGIGDLCVYLKICT